MQTGQEVFAEYRKALIGLPVAHVWRGHGSALFLEFGALTPNVRQDGSPGNPDGEISAMIEWSWRIERGPSIICGSWSDEALWQSAFDRISGAAVTDASTFGRLPELLISLTGDLHVASFMTAEGDPRWALMDHRAPRHLPTVHSRDGQLRVES